MAWVDPDTYGWIYHPQDDADWDALISATGGGPRFAAVVDVARASGCQTVVVENRYVDPDYRSDYSAFWSKRFDSISPFARRAHFFRARLQEEVLHSLPADPGYLGYSVLRPGPHADGHVGRTLLVAPPSLERATIATIKDEISFFGTTLTVEGAPFSEQDGEFLRCAHAAIWACHYSAYRRGLVGRRLTADLVDLAPALLSPERALPSRGLTPIQIQAIFAATDQPALVYSLEHMPKVLGVDNPTPQLDPADPNKTKTLPAGLWDTRMFSVICRYLNSHFPVMVMNGSHAIVIVGWFFDNKQIRFVACDDQEGPYEIIESPFTDSRAPWRVMMVPLPPKVLMSGEMAENWAFRAFRGFGSYPGVPTGWTELAQALAGAPKRVSLRTFLREGGAYKASVRRQGRSPNAVRELCLARLPHYVWVVEAQDRDRRAANQPCVIAEAVFDPNSSDHEHREPRTDAISMPGLAVITPPDGGIPVSVTHAEQAWTSHLAL